MVTLEHIPSIYVVSYYNSLYWAWNNKCGGTNYSEATLVAAINDAIAALSSGGMIWLKELQNPGGLNSYSSSILIVEEYHGTIKFYSNNVQIGEIGSDNYQTTSEDFSTYTPTGSVFNGRVVTVYSTSYIGGVALFTYANGSWHYVQLS
jgi:hypothetical protein